jgi:hypothetical protein
MCPLGAEYQRKQNPRESCPEAGISLHENTFPENPGKPENFEGASVAYLAKKSKRALKK